MVEEIEEKWFRIPRKIKTRHDSIEAISNTGKLKRYNGSVEIMEYDQCLRVNKRRVRVYTLVAECFLITVKRPEQEVIDHITHNPNGMNINDVRNLRWCTQAENNNFSEHKTNLSKSLMGRKGLDGEKNPMFGKRRELSQFWKSGHVTKRLERQRKRRELRYSQNS